MRCAQPKAGVRLAYRSTETQHPYRPEEGQECKANAKSRSLWPPKPLQPAVLVRFTATDNMFGDVEESWLLDLWPRPRRRIQGRVPASAATLHHKDGQKHSD
jgi:hypothetical protein